MKAPPILEENSWKIETKPPPLYATPHENQSQRPPPATESPIPNPATPEPQHPKNKE